ncbi:hypothetical protein J2X60_000967 [Curtobacterium sp. 320]|uniref:hypothetical protein n=1 Tax=Curtobacterium sp. 320 TaxID=2817749 RepID=UPI0028593F94|nr:hypothetical protein [Curtobacterium sp. 320]MDR6572331.1 hypothetical protein [Curtobacterium sp. 320]
MGNKYGRQKRAQQRRDEAALLDAHDQSERWTRDPTEPVWEQEPFVEIGDVRIYQRTVRYESTNEVVEFAVTVTRREGGSWREMLCIDTRHRATVHRHWNGDHDSEPEHIRDIYSTRDIQIGLVGAVDEAYDFVNEQER